MAPVSYASFWHRLCENVLSWKDSLKQSWKMRIYVKSASAYQSKYLRFCVDARPSVCSQGFHTVWAHSRQQSFRWRFSTFECVRSDFAGDGRVICKWSPGKMQRGGKSDVITQHVLSDNYYFASPLRLYHTIFDQAFLTWTGLINIGWGIIDHLLILFRANYLSAQNLVASFS